VTVPISLSFIGLRISCLDCNPIPCTRVSGSSKPTVIYAHLHFGFVQYPHLPSQGMAQTFPLSKEWLKLDAQIKKRETLKIKLVSGENGSWKHSVPLAREREESEPHKPTNYWRINNLGDRNFGMTRRY
jgi:hypothetical protein